MMKRHSFLRFQSTRRTAGYMLILFAGIAGAMIFLCYIALSVCHLFVTSDRLRTDAEHYALYAAIKLNEDNCLGKINLMQGSSRELIQQSRTVYESLDSPQTRATQGIAEQLLTEARDNKKLVDKATSAWLQLKLAEIRQSGGAASPCDFTSAISLPWSASSAPRIVDVEVGSLTEIESNVDVLDGEDASLKEFDLDSRYADKSGTYYIGNQILRLPNSDADLQFPIARLAPYVSGKTSAARLVSSGNFKPQATVIDSGSISTEIPQFLPSAVRVKLQARVVGKVMKGFETTETATAVAVTRGADKPLE